jgi:metal-responsive CopG/Arc/MetJ family transcriptional regulator
MVLFFHTKIRRDEMSRVVKRTISLPYDLSLEVERIAKDEGKTVSAVIQEALRILSKKRLEEEFYEIQGYWSKKAKEKGVITEEDLERYLNE